MSMCRNCWFDPAKARGLCPACLQYERDNDGKSRPAKVIDRHITRKLWPSKT